MARELLGLPLDGRDWQTQLTYPTHLESTDQSVQDLGTLISLLP